MNVSTVLTVLKKIMELANLIVAGNETSSRSPDHEAILVSLKLTREDLLSIGEEIAGFKETVRSYYI